MQFHNFIGWSDGGQVALEIALRHPTLVRKLVISGTDVKPRPQPLLGWARSAKPEDWPKEHSRRLRQGFA